MEAYIESIFRRFQHAKLICIKLAGKFWAGAVIFRAIVTYRATAWQGRTNLKTTYKLLRGKTWLDLTGHLLYSS